MIDPADTEFKETVVKSVDEGEASYSIGLGSGGCIGLSKEHGVEPRVGDSIRLYGRGFGYTVRGIVINGRVAYYRTADEERERHAREVAESQRKKREQFEAEIAKHDAAYDALPPIFRRRVDRFRASGPDWRWEYEPYEVFCCQEAVKIANAFRGHEHSDSAGEALDAFAKAGYEEQRKTVPDLSDQHSGNTFGASVRLAYWWLAEPENVVREHGVLSVLVGCEAYGCRHEGS